MNRCCAMALGVFADINDGGYTVGGSVGSGDALLASISLCIATSFFLSPPLFACFPPPSPRPPFKSALPPSLSLLLSLSPSLSFSSHLSLCSSHYCAI